MLKKFKSTPEKNNQDVTETQSLEQIANIFDQQIIPLMLTGQITELQLNNCLVNVKNTKKNILFTIDLSSMEKTDTEVKNLQKYISGIRGTH